MGFLTYTSSLEAHQFHMFARIMCQSVQAVLLLRHGYPSHDVGA